MRFASLGSGSKGNAMLVEEGQTLLMIDCGFSLKETEMRLARLGKAPSDVTAILVTHEHADHVQGVAMLANKYEIPVHTTPGTAIAMQWRHIEQYIPIDVHQSFEIDDLSIRPVAVAHDAKEPSQFVIGNGNERLGVLTDVGSITTHLRQEYAGCTAYFVECNHDRDMLFQGAYPESLKRRVGGDYGHLSNDQAACFLKSVITEATRDIVIGHLSEKNNTPVHACRAVATALNCDEKSIGVADQHTGLNWRIL